MVVVVAALLVTRSLLLRDQARAVPTDEVVDRFRTANTPPASTTTDPDVDGQDTPSAGATPSTSETPDAGGSSAPVASDAPSADGTSAEVTGGDRDGTGRDRSSDGAAGAGPATVSGDALDADENLAATLGAADPLGLVDPGVYLYRTMGGESIDALGGTTHEYPASTTITVLPDDCGVSLRWDVLVERWERWRLCVGTDGVVLQPDGGVYFHEFYGRSERERLACDRPVPLVPVDRAPREPVQLVCRLQDRPWMPVWEVLGRTTRKVDGQDVDVQHVRMTVRDDDDFWERIDADWFLADNGLPVAIRWSKASRSPTLVGPVEYEEEYELRLESFDPLR